MKNNHKADVSHTDEFDRMYQEMVKQAEDKYKVKSEHPKTEEGIGLVDNLSSRWVNEFSLPDGYIFVDENGNVINATKIVLEKKKPKYPQTYEECCKVLGISGNELLFDATKATTYELKRTQVVAKLYKLLICRDAYWKLAGDWKPNWNANIVGKYCMGACLGRIEKHLSGGANYILAFPTEEMRDAFYENFKKEIETVKELL